MSNIKQFPSRMRRRDHKYFGECSDRLAEMFTELLHDHPEFQKCSHEYACVIIQRPADFDPGDLEEDSLEQTHYFTAIETFYKSMLGRMIIGSDGSC